MDEWNVWSGSRQIDDFRTWRNFYPAGFRRRRGFIGRQFRFRGENNAPDHAAGPAACCVVFLTACFPLPNLRMALSNPRRSRRRSDAGRQLRGNRSPLTGRGQHAKAGEWQGPLTPCTIRYSMDEPSAGRRRVPALIRVCGLAKPMRSSRRASRRKNRGESEEADGLIADG